VSYLWRDLGASGDRCLGAQRCEVVELNRDGDVLSHVERELGGTAMSSRLRAARDAMSFAKTSDEFRRYCKRRVSPSDAAVAEPYQ
jgi:hypothetical protein